MAASLRTRSPMLIVFLDLDGYKAACTERGDLEVADMIDDYYDRVSNAVQEAGGRVVKFIGDGAMLIFTERSADPGVSMLLDLIPRVNAFMREPGTAGCEPKCTLATSSRGSSGRLVQRGST